MDPEQVLLVHQLCHNTPFPHETHTIECIETHISWVILTGPYAYKIKKAVNFGFLDFSTLAKRRFFCEEELRLNRRLAPHWYLEIVAISGTPKKPYWGESAEVVEYAVKMRQFSSNAPLDRQLVLHMLNFKVFDDLALKIAAFHHHTEIAPATSNYGTPAQLMQTVRENFDQLRAQPSCLPDPHLLTTLTAWAENQYQHLHPDFSARKQQGFIRECHGDMHLRNIAMEGHELIIFDGIEFNAALRWIDVMSEIAFTVMDLQARRQDAFAHYLLSAYLESSGDYQGLRVFNFYCAYRAMVRAKVACLQSATTTEFATISHLRQEVADYLLLARRYSHLMPTALILMHGFSGSGKSSLSQKLLELLPALRVRSDVERKRLFKSAVVDQTQAAARLYQPKISAAVYEHLSHCARNIIQSGYHAIVDAAFLKAHQRRHFFNLAEELQIPILIISCSADLPVTKMRLSQRQQQNHHVSDADLHVLEQQINNHDALSPQELQHCLVVDTSQTVDNAALVQTINTLLKTQS